MAEDTIQASTPTVPTFGQQPITPAAFGFGMSSSNVPHPPGIGISLTPVKLNDTNYLLWSRVIKKYLTAQAKEKYLTDTKPADDAKEYQKWVQEDAMVTTWLWNSMEPSIATSIMWVDTTKELWDSLQDRFGQSKNISQTTALPTETLAQTGTGSSIFGSTLSAVTSTESSISVGVSTPVTNAGGVFGITSPITGTGNSIFGFSAGGSSAATSQTLFPNSFTAGSAQASGAGNNGVVSSTQTIPVQFGSSATSSSFGLAGNPGFSSSSSPFGSSISAAKPFSSAPSFGLNSATSLSEANSGSGTTPSVFGSSWQAPKSVFGSSTSAPFQFSASASSVATNSAPVFGSSTGAPSGSLFPFTSTAAAPSSQPAFGNPSSVNPFGTAPSNNNDQIGMEDSMAEDTIQASTPTVPAFGQQPITLAASGFGFNMAAQPNMAAQSSPFQFSSQQNVANPQNPNLFQSSNSLEFNAAAGGSFSLGSGGGDKSNRRIVKIKNKQRRK